MSVGPGSALLEQELAQKIRRHGIVVWLDREATFTAFVQRLAARQGTGAFPSPVISFAGSFLELLFALEAHGSGYDKSPLLLHMPGFTQDTIRQTPVLELYEAGTSFLKALNTLAREAAAGRVPPTEVDQFLASNPTLDQVDAWLARAGGQSSGGLARLLEASGPALVLEALSTGDSVLAQQVASEADAQVLKDYLHTLTGMDDDWLSFTAAGSAATSLERVLFALAAWVLCVEYVHDLRREAHLPPLRRLKTLSPALLKANARLIGQLRGQHPEVYARRADEVEGVIAAELAAMTPEDLGNIDTFRQEEDAVLGGAVEALKARDWAKARQWCAVRAKSFWSNGERTRRWAWDLVSEAAAFGSEIAAHPRPFEKVASHDEALAIYATGAFEVDRAHRRFEQERARKLDPMVPHFGRLQEVVGDLRRLHRDWADQLARDFARLCRATSFLPPAALQQRSLYEQVVQPIAAEDERVAVFLIDAFRYEMATELLDDLRAVGTSVVVDLKGRLAELPTITPIGMNALAPAARNDRLTPVTAGDAFQGFRSGEFTVRTPADRARAMGMRTSGKPGVLIGLVDLCDRTQETLKKLKDHAVVVVHSTELDDGGEANLGVHTFEATLNQVRAAWHHLQTAGIKHAVFTADHGFLLQDETTEIRPFGKKPDPHRRYVFDAYERAENGMTPVPLPSLGYDGMEGFLLFLDDTAVFATRVAGSSFVHGGNSPQERFIPVLTVTRKRIEASGFAEYAVEAKPEREAFGFSRIGVRVVFPPDTQTGLSFVGPRTIALDLRVPDRPDVKVTVKEVSGPGVLRAGRVEMPVKSDWTDVYFSLEGSKDERTRIEVYHPDAIEKVRPTIVDALFSVSGTQPRAPGGEKGRAASAAWAMTIEDEAVRNIFQKIDEHGSITEAEIIHMLGNPRAARRFALNFDGYLAKLPFKVRSEANASGKRYTREEDM